MARAVPVIQVLVEATCFCALPTFFMDVYEDLDDGKTRHLTTDKFSYLFHKHHLYNEWDESNKVMVLYSQFMKDCDPLVKCAYNTPNRSVVTFNYATKIRQAKIIAEKAERFPDMKVLKTRDLWRRPTDVTGTFILKPYYGARGLCQTVVDFSKVSLETLLEAFRENDMEYFTTTTGLELTRGTTHRTPQAMKDTEKQFRNRDFVLTEYLENIDREFRVITDGYGRPHMVMERNRIETDIPGYLQGTGIKGAVHVLKSKYEFLQVMGPEASNLYDMLLSFEMPVGSFDVFQLKNNQGRPQFGLFEFSQHFGIVGLPKDVLEGYAADFLDSVATKHNEHYYEAV